MHERHNAKGIKGIKSSQYYCPSPLELELLRPSPSSPDPGGVDPDEWVPDAKCGEPRGPNCGDPAG